MKIEIKDKNGVLLKTSGTYCAENIEVVPVVEDITVTPSKEAQVETPSEGYCGIGQVNIGAVTADIDANIVPENIKEGVSILGVVGTLSGGSGETPSLYAPTIAISDTGVLTVTDTRNGAFADKYYLVIDDVQGAEITNKTVDLTTVFADYAVGVYNVKVRVTSPNNELLAADSTVLTYGVYSITYTLTHVTAATAPAKILQGAQAEITLAADTGWFLPAEVSVANASIVEYDVATGKLIIGSANGNVGVVVEGSDVEPIVAKGKIITIESKQYRVIKVAGNVAEVLAMYDASTSLRFNATSKTVAFSSGRTGQQYQGSDLDTYLNETFFATLSATMQAAILPKAINQDMWGHGDSVPSSGTYYHQTGIFGSRYYYDNASGVSYGTAEVGTRNVYALSVREVIDYLGVPENGDFTGTDIWQMFWNDNSSHYSQFLWLRSAAVADSTNVLIANGNYGNLYGSSYGNGFRVRPAFQIDLSKVEWTAE
nr:MAG TPA: hypothetical protein [Caudoviricetes sp.]